jgi:hypothetical protein
MPNEQDHFTSFVEFINQQLDMSGLDAPQPFTQADFSQLLSDDIYAETLRIVRAEMRDPDGLPLKFGMMHREVLYHLSNILSKILRARYPERLDADEWRDAAALAIALAWLVRARLDADDPSM